MENDNQITHELYTALKETLDKIKAVYSGSGYYQQIDYTASNNNTENWLFKAREAIKKYESLKTI